ncbi:hypothetical protein [Vibrio fluvialis]|uniref:hypothetical protein n=1 Tax=Vibrio fluvialis TaxID=676 RepID=UPI001559EEBD|nr:hypothetical protein [Vibrio fluvialis]
MADIIDDSLNEIRRELKERLTTLLAKSELAQKACLPRLMICSSQTGHSIKRHFVVQS